MFFVSEIDENLLNSLLRKEYKNFFSLAQFTYAMYSVVNGSEYITVHRRLCTDSEDYFTTVMKNCLEWLCGKHCIYFLKKSFNRKNKVFLNYLQKEIKVTISKSLHASIVSTKHTESISFF